MNSPYSHILAAVEVNDFGERVLQRALDLARVFEARLSVIHAVEFIPLDAGAAMIMAPTELGQQLESQAREQLLSMCGKLGIPESAVQVVTGGVVTEILRASKALAADLVVVGHRPHSGLASLFTYTDESVVHKACCDVLALNVG
ncbi:MAG: universal stress protein [Stenotrophobium sp.]